MTDNGYTKGIAVGSKWRGVNYLKDYAASRELADSIIAYYRGNPAYPHDFHKRIEVRVQRDPNTDDYYIRSNLDQLFESIITLERKVNAAR